MAMDKQRVLFLTTRGLRNNLMLRQRLLEAEKLMIL
jgi:hypothetical protein